MKKYIILLFLWFSTLVSRGQTPGGVAGVSQWYKNTSATATQWTDASGNNNHVPVSSAAPTTTSSTVNFNPMVTFNGSTQRYRRTTAMTNAPTNTSGATYFYIAKTGTIDVSAREVFGRGGWYYNDGISSGRYSSQLHAGSYYAGYTQDARIDNAWVANELKLVRCGYSSGASNTLYVSQNGGNEVVAGAATTKTFNNDFAIGIVGPDNATYAWSGDIGEIIAFPSKLSATDYKKVESCLAIKYGMTLNQTTANNYLNSSGGVVWNATTNAGFNNNIAGIARDSATDLNQKQTRSINQNTTQLLISTTGAANSNALNTTSLSNNQYLIWGDNGQARSMSVSLSGSTIVNTRFAAVWKVQNTNNVGTVRVMWPSGINNLNLIQSNDATFDGSDVITPMNNTMVINGTTFNYVDITLANGQFITFGTYIIAPGGVTAGLVAWYKADSGTNTTINGANVTSWINLMGGAATIPAGYTSPTYLPDFHNFNPTLSVETEGYARGLVQNNLFANDAARPLTMYTVGSRPQYNSGNLITWSGFNDGLNGWESPWIGSYLSNYYYYNINGNSSIDISSIGMSSYLDNYPYINGLTQLSGAAMATTGTNFIKNGRTVSHNGNTSGTRTVKPNYHIFWDWNTTALGKIPESIVYNRVLTSIERNKVESYLAIKYGITLKSDNDNSTNGLASRNYVNSSNDIIWSISGHSYNHNVFGIARDDVSLLNQSISRSENFRIGNSVILKTATINNFTLPNNNINRTKLTNDNNYIMFGDNNNMDIALDVVNPVSCPALSDGLMQIKRKWRVQETGSVAPIFIEVDLSSYTLASNIQLWVGDNEALTTNSYTIPALSIVGGKAVFQVDFKDSAVQFFTVVGKVGAPACQVCRGGKYIVRQGNSWNTAAKKQNDSTGWFTYGTDGESTSLQARNIVAHTTPSNEWVDVWYPAPYGSSALIPHVGTTNGAASKRVYTTVLNRAGKVNFSMAGISEYYGNKVKVVVKGFCGAGQVNPIITPMVNSVWNGYTISGNTVTGSKYYREINVYSQVKVSFNSPVERVEVEYTVERNPVYYTHFWFTLGDMSVECESPIEPNKNNVYIKQSFENDNIAACNEAELKLNIMNKNCNNRVLSFIKNDLPSGLEYVPNSYTGPGTPSYSGQSFLLENLNMSSGDTNIFVKVRATNPDAIVSSTNFNTQSKYVVTIASGGVGDTVLSDNLSILTGLQATTLTLNPKIPTVMPEMEFTSNNGQDACDTIGYTITIINNTGATRSGLQLQPFLNLGQILNGSVALSSGLTGAVIPNPQNNETTFFIPSLSVPVGTHTITFSTVATKIDEFAKNTIELFYDPTSNECALANKKVANLNRKCPTCEDGKGLFKMNNAWNNGGATARNSNQILNITVGNPGSGVIKAEAVVTYPLSGGQSIEWYPTFFPRMNGKWTEISRNDNLNGVAGKVFYEMKLKDNGGSLIAARPSFQVAGMTKISGQEDIVSIKGYCGLDEILPKLRYTYNSTPANNAYYRRFVIDSANASAKGIAPYYDNTDWASMNIEFEKPVDRFIIEWSVNRSPIYKTQSNLYIGNVDFICDNKPEPNPDDVHVLSSIVGADTLPHCQEGIIKLNIKNWNCDPRTINLTSTLPAGIQFVDSSYNGIGSETPTMSGQNFSLSNLSVPSGNSYLYMKVKSINNTTASYATNFKYTVQGGTNNPNPYQSDDNSSLEGFQDLVINFESSPIIEKPTLVLKTDKECYEKGDTILYTMIFNNSSSSSLTNVEIIERMDNVKFLERVNATTFGGTILSEDSLGFYISDAVIPVGKDSILYKAVVLDTVKYIENLFEITIDPVSPCGNINNSMSNLHKIDTAFYNLGLTTGTPKNTNVGITAMDKHKQAGWPMQMPNAWIALHSKTKGFVISRTTAASIPTPVEGMLIYDTLDNCIKLYNGTVWNCIQRQCK